MIPTHPSSTKVICYRARSFAHEAHTGQYDKGDKPYIEHLRYVASRVPVEYQPIAWLHDVVEDTTVTLDQIRDEFGADIAHAVDCLTKRFDESYDEYLERVASCKAARVVKCADLMHNMDLSRLPVITVKDAKRVVKYANALAYLLSFE